MSTDARPTPRQIVYAASGVALGFAAGAGIGIALADLVVIGCALIVGLIVGGILAAQMRGYAEDHWRELYHREANEVTTLRVDVMRLENEKESLSAELRMRNRHTT